MTRRNWLWELYAEIPLPAGYYLWRSRQSGVLDLTFGSEDFLRWWPAEAPEHETWEREVSERIDQHMLDRYKGSEILADMVGEVWPA